MTGKMSFDNIVRIIRVLRPECFMARYTCLFTVALPNNSLRQSLIEILKSLNIEVQYDTAEYLMGREKPGKVPFGKLVTVEVLIDNTTATETEIKMTLVAKNEELPLQLNNHCHKLFQQVSEQIEGSSQLKLINTVPG